MAGSLRSLGKVIRPMAARLYHSEAALTIDMRSDVLTRPSTEMREAMLQASYGDDVFNEDQSVSALQDKMAEMCGKQAALFVPSGTMGNLISVVSHCHDGKGQEVILGDQSHLVVYEQGGLAVLGGIHPRTVPNKPDGTFDLDKVRESIRPLDDPHQPLTALVCVENTHNNCGGKVAPMSFINKVSSLTREHNLKFHMDGARMLNACVALNVSPRDMLQNIDSASICLSKGVGAPVGSVIVGTHELIARAIRLRKILGGGWRQPGLLAAAAAQALEDVVPRMQRDHAHAKLLAKEIHGFGRGVVCVDVEGVHSNMVMVHMTKFGLTAAEFCNRLNQVTEDEAKVTGERVKVKALPFYKHIARLVTYSNITRDDIEAVVSKLRYVVEEYADEQTHSRAREQLLSEKVVQRVGRLATEANYNDWEDLQYDLAYRR